jgi:hypothetical protein
MDANNKIKQSVDTDFLNQQLVDVEGGIVLSSYENDQSLLNVVETEPTTGSIANETVQDAHQMGDNINLKADRMMETMEHETIDPTPEIVTSQNESTTTVVNVAKNNKDNDENKHNITTDNDMESEDAMSESLSTTRQNEYINHGLATWERNRERWLKRNELPTSNGNTINCSNNNHTTNHNHNTTYDNRLLSQKHAKPINVDEIIDALFTSHKKILLINQSHAANNMNNNMSDTTTIPFPHAVPLPQLVDILQDLWEAEST